MPVLALVASVEVRSIIAAVFWCCVLGLLYVYIGYPLLLAILARLISRTRKQLGYCPSLTVLIAAYNEEANIKRKVEETLALEYPPDKLEILVVSDGSTDRTDEIIKTFSDRRVRLLRVDDRNGKTHAQNEGVRQANGEIIVFSDATAVYHAKALLYLACNYEDTEVAAVSGRYQYFDPDATSPTGLGSVAFWNYENMIKKFQSDIRTLTGCSGCIYSVRKDCYVPLPATACSDLVEPLCVVRSGRRVVFEDRALAYEETTKSTGDEFRMRVRVATRGIRGVLTVRELLNVSKYGWISFQLVSHKLMRWLVPIYLIVILLTSALLAGEFPYNWFLGLQIVFYIIGVVAMLVPLHRRWRPLGIPLYFCTLNIAALLGLVEAFRGQQYTVWETVRR
jgi:cellulose synthase/poly-beta-1,6-N-acetylglucosamine synthase-like glycosyltransferase